MTICTTCSGSFLELYKPLKQSLLCGFTNINNSRIHHDAGATAAVKTTTSLNIADGMATTQQITSGAFVAGEVEASANNILNATVNFSSPNSSEMEFCFQINSAYAIVGDTLQLRLSNLNGYTIKSNNPRENRSAILNCGLIPVYGSAGVIYPGCGNRLKGKRPLPKCVLVVEDTASSGNAIQEAAQKAAKNWPHAKIIKVAIYASSRGAKACDLVGKIYERPHFLEWNFPNAWIYANMAYDFDGIFCEDCPKEADDDGPTYEEFLRNAKPKYLPRKYPVKQIVTARLEKWRPQTEEWLRRHRIAFQELAMGPWLSLAVRRAAHDVDKFKAYCLAHSSCYAFAESEPAQAESICRLARKPVLCPEARRFFVPHGYSWPRMSKSLKA